MMPMKLTRSDVHRINILSFQYLNVSKTRRCNKYLVKMAKGFLRINIILVTKCQNVIQYVVKRKKNKVAK